MLASMKYSPSNSFAQAASKASGQRFLFIDGLRAFAAIFVVLFHFYDAISQTANSWAWQWVETLFSYGYLGVDVFFVLSGFVISYSIRKGEFSLRYLVRFGFRRSIRLDPAYWMTILIEITLIYLGLALFPSLDTPIPDLPTIISHLFYAQDLLGHGNIVSIFWTLCYEFQFYIVLVGVLVLANSAGNLFQRPLIIKFILGIGGTAAFIWSLTIFFGSAENPLPGLFINRWWQFFLGCLLTVHILKVAPSLCFFLGVIALVIAILLDTNSGIDNGLATLLIVSIVYAASKTKGMEKWLASSLPQFLGKLSYSIYLLHAVIGWRFIKLLHELNGADFTPWQAWLALIAGVAVSIISAWIMHGLLEAPSHRFSKAINLPEKS